MKNLSKYTRLTSAILLAACSQSVTDLDDGQMHNDEQAPAPEVHIEVESGGIPQVDRMYYNQAQNKAYIINLGEQTRWHNPKTGHQGEITPTREGKNSKGEYCREFQSTHNINITVESSYHMACQTINGTWHINP